MKTPRIYQGTVDPDEDVRLYRRHLHKTGVYYGLIFGIGFAIFTWGYDAYQLSRVGAAFPWVKGLIGTPFALLICGLAGGLAARASAMILVVAIWGAASWALGALSGHIPFEGANLAIWLTNPRLWGEVVYSFGSAAEVRTTLLTFTMVGFGLAVGFFQTQAVQWAWNRTTPSRKLGWTSWAALLVAAPLALVPAAVAHNLVYQPLRAHQETLGTILQRTLAGNIEASRVGSYRSLEPYKDRLSADYATHFVTFSSDTGTWHSAYIDVLFPDDFALRCVIAGQQVVYCEDLTAVLMGWADDLVRAGLYGERPWESARIQKLAVDEAAAAWLESHRAQFSEAYQVSLVDQQNGWIFMDLRFDTGFEMVCRFHSAAPVVMDQCTSPLETP